MPLSPAPGRPRRLRIARLAVLLAALVTAGVTWAPGAPDPGAPAPFDVDAAAFHATLGYTPHPAPGRADVLLRPDGECSTPTGGTVFGFDDACREHDLAYDLLRYHDRRGEPVDPRDRWAADARFALRMVGHCETTATQVGPCVATAGVYAAAVTVNSVRQLYGAPGEETVGGVVGSVAVMLGAVVLAAAPGRVVRSLRRGRRASGRRRPHNHPATGAHGLLRSAHNGA